jgi:hypothetical protein
MSRPTPGTPGAKPRQPTVSPVDQRFHAVAIKCGSKACAAAQQLASSRFLSRQMPPALPLSDCSQPASCTCKYQHHQDRRDDARREADTGIWSTHQLLEPDINRRRGQGRRKRD